MENKNNLNPPSIIHHPSSALILLATLIICLCLPHHALAQTLTLDMGKGGGTATGKILQLIALTTILSLAPSILMMVTSFTRIIIVLSLLRSAMGIQQSPPNSVLISLALFMTAFIMAPAATEAYHNGIVPLMDEKITNQQAFTAVVKPFHGFMMKNVREKDLALFMDMAKIDEVASPEETPLHVLIPAFMISELKRSFEIGFLIYIPFLIIDMMVASTLMSMGMMMLPPVLISLPFKLIFFVLVDGWYMICGSLIKSFVT